MFRLGVPVLGICYGQQTMAEQLGGAVDVARVLKSATANAENNHNLSAEDLIVADAIANEGPTIKRFRPRAQGRAFPIHKPMTHITIVVADQEA